jgi:hypothetical protein
MFSDAGNITMFVYPASSGQETAVTIRISPGCRQGLRYIKTLPSIRFTVSESLFLIWKNISPSLSTPRGSGIPENVTYSSSVNTSINMENYSLR